MKLYFLRHGPAADREDWPGNDAERPLTDEGVKLVERVAATIAGLGLEPDFILTSPLVRARQTAAVLAAVLHMKNKLRVDDRLGPDLDTDQLAAILGDHQHSRSLMMVGHEPGIGRAISALIGGARVVCKKGGLACVRIDDPPSSQGELLWLIPPNILTRRDG